MRRYFIEYKEENQNKREALRDASQSLMSNLKNFSEKKNEG